MKNASSFREIYAWKRESLSSGYHRLAWARYARSDQAKQPFHGQCSIHRRRDWEIQGIHLTSTIRTPQNKSPRLLLAVKGGYYAGG